MLTSWKSQPHTSMVKNKEFVTIHNKKIKLSPNLNHKNSGIYLALCINCDNSYVGQTKISFSIRWSAHRNNCKKLKLKFSIKGLSDEFAQYINYYNIHNDNLKNTNINKAYKVGFLQQPNFQNLDYKKIFWIENFKLTINLAKTPYSDLNLKLCTICNIQSTF